MKNDTKKKGYAETYDYAEAMDDAQLKGMTKKELAQYLSVSNKKLQALENQLAAILKQKDAEPARHELIIDALSAEKKIIDEMSDNMVAACSTGEKRIVKSIKARMIPEIERYNALVDEFAKNTGGILTRAPLTIPDDIMAGREYTILPLLSYTMQPTDDYDADNQTVTVMGHKQFVKYANDTDKAMAPITKEYNQTLKNIDATEGQDKVIMILVALGLKKKLIDSNTDLLIAARQAKETKDIALARKRLDTDVKDYNKLVDQYAAVTNNQLTRASETLSADIVEGRPYALLPDITYTVTDPTEREEVDYKTAKKRQKNKAVAAATVAAGTLEAKVIEQANKDLSVLTKAADFEISMLESERDMCRYRFGKSQSVTKQRKKEISREIEQIKAKHAEALKYEEADNKRYYAVVTNDPATMKVERKKVDRNGIASVRTRMITLLNRRDEINGQLASIYTGFQLNKDGTSVNQEWRRVKNAAAERAIADDKKLVNKIEKLPATPAEKQRIYAVMNQKLDAISTIAVCNYRLKNEKKIPRKEVKAIKQDIKNQQGIITRCNSDVDYMADAIRKRAKGEGKSYGAAVVMMLILIVGGIGAALAYASSLGFNIVM